MQHLHLFTDNINSYVAFVVNKKILHSLLDDIDQIFYKQNKISFGY